MPPKYKILVPMDFSELSKEALTVAARIADRTGGRLIVLHVEEEATILVQGVHLAAYAKQAMEERSLGNVAFRAVMARGSAAREIVARARRHQADAIVMSTHARSGFNHLLLGSVAEEVLRHAPCPVLILNPNVAEASKDGRLNLGEMVLEAAGDFRENP